MRLDLLIYITNGERNEYLPKDYKIVFSDATHLVMTPKNGKAIIAFDIDVFVEIDTDKLWDNIKELVRSKYHEYDSVQLGLTFDPFLKKDKSMSDYIKIIGESFEAKSDFFMYYYKELKMKDMNDIVKARTELEEKLKSPKIGSLVDSIGESEVWKSLKEDQLKRLYGEFGYLVTGNKKLIEKDIEKIKKFVDDFIPADNKFAKKFKKDLVSRWISVYVRHINL